MNGENVGDVAVRVLSLKCIVWHTAEFLQLPCRYVVPDCTADIITSAPTRPEIVEMLVFLSFFF